MHAPAPKRRYHSPRRQAQAAATRARLLEAARQLFVAHSYAATTLPAIARAAGVSAPTVTAVFGSKPAILEALIATTTRGDEMPTPLRERDWWHAMLREPDPRQLLARYAAAVRGIHERTTDIFEIVRGAATADPEIAAKRAALADGRHLDSQTVAEALAAHAALRSGVSVEQAADSIWALASGELYRMLAVERGWPPEQYERWLAEGLASALLAHVSERG
jgi:AcrR family transcriptional regulator